MTLHVNIDGTWTENQQAYVKYAGAWRKAKGAWAKIDGVWEQAYVYDVIPPSPPVLTVDAVKQHLKVGVRQPEAGHQSEVAMIRVLVQRESFPSTPLSSGFYRTADKSYPYEPWSEYYYNGHKVGTNRDHDSTATIYYKEFPVNAGDDTLVGKGLWYFSAWTMDVAGNWSEPTRLRYNVDDDRRTPLISRAATFVANDSGTWPVTGSTFVQGDLKQRGNPASYGVWYHGLEIKRNIGDIGSKVTMRKAQIYAYRDPNDQGPQEACVYVYYHAKADAADGKPPITGSALVGKLAKGVGKWFPLPDSHLAAMKNNVALGFGLDYRAPNRAEGMAEDFSTVVGVGGEEATAANARSGSVYVLWTEDPN